jgi:RNA polymerase sigma-70 factor (ECF subfamily)
MDRVELVVAAQSGDVAAMAALVDEFAATVHGAAYGWCGDAHLAADIAQEAFATVLARIGDVRDPAAFPGWLMSVVRTAATRAHRVHRWGTTDGIDRPADERGPEAAVVAADEVERVRLAVEALPPHLRLPVVLHYVAGRTVADIAHLCDVPVSTVKQRMRVARARLRDGMDEMAEETLCRLRPTADDDPTDVIRFYVAMRSGDVARVASILDARPDLVDVREHWTRDDSFTHRLPWTAGGGTPLLRAIERGDDAMVALLLDRGADPNGACECAGGERPLWTAVSHGRARIVDRLLAHGADPDGTAFEGTTPLRVALQRGEDAIASALRRAGARDVDGWSMAGPLAIEIVPGAASIVTGIRAIDLWAPLPAAGLARLTPGFGIGAVVLVAELSTRFARAGHGVVWTGFVQAPTDLGDVAHALAESGIGDTVDLHLDAPTAPREAQVAALDRGIAAAGDGLLVVFEETGFGAVIDERLPALARRAGTTIVVAPLDGSVAPPPANGTPYLASITFDIERARRGQWPAVGHRDSWSKAVDADGAALAAAARDVIERGDDAAARLHEWLAQAFFVSEAVLDVPGVFTPVEELRASVRALVQPNA